MCNNNWIGSSGSFDPSLLNNSDGNMTAYLPVTFSYRISAGSLTSSNNGDSSSDCGCGCNSGDRDSDCGCGCRNNSRSFSCGCGCRRRFWNCCG